MYFIPFSDPTRAALLRSAPRYCAPFRVTALLSASPVLSASPFLVGLTTGVAGTVKSWTLVVAGTGE